MLRICTVCKGPITDEKRKVTCSQECAMKRQQERLARNTLERKQSRHSEPKKCKWCCNEFSPSHYNTKYCSLECKEKGFQQAVKNQMERRKANSHQLST